MQKYNIQQKIIGIIGLTFFFFVFIFYDKEGYSLPQPTNELLVKIILGIVVCLSIYRLSLIKNKKVVIKDDFIEITDLFRSNKIPITSIKSIEFKLMPYNRRSDIQSTESKNMGQIRVLTANGIKYSSEWIKDKEEFDLLRDQLKLLLGKTSVIFDENSKELIEDTSAITSKFIQKSLILQIGRIIRLVILGLLLISILLRVAGINFK